MNKYLSGPSENFNYTHSLCNYMLYYLTLGVKNTTVFPLKSAAVLI